MILAHLDTLYHGIQNFRIDGERIAAVDAGDQLLGHQDTITFKDCMVVPGLINSHDHLDFNLFPQLGNRHYKNYMDWGTDLHGQNSDVIRTILAIPKELRTQWGIYKNLLNGITTVVQHGERLTVDQAAVNLFHQCYSLHSVGLEKRWRYQLNKPFLAHQPIVIHIGEGTDHYSFNEINELLRWNLFKRKIVGVHGVVMTEKQASRFHALVWCPDSNFFTLGKTASIDKLKSATRILFGTDSTLSAHWSIWNQLRKARATGLLTDEELIAAVSTVPAAVWGLKYNRSLRINQYADLLITKKKHPSTSNTEAFFATAPEDVQLILNKGAIVYFDATLLPQLRQIDLGKYSKILISGKCKYVLGRLDHLISQIKKYAPEAHFPVQVAT